MWENIYIIPPKELGKENNTNEILAIFLYKKKDLKKLK